MKDFDFSKGELDKIILTYKLRNLFVKCVFFYTADDRNCDIYLWKNIFEVLNTQAIEIMRWYGSFSHILKDTEEFIRDNFKVKE